MGIAASTLDRPYPYVARRVLQVVMYLALLIYIGELALIYYRPEWGLRVFWFATIPLAPMILLVAPNLWVSVCPISTVQTLSHRAGRNPQRRLGARATAGLQALGWVVMFAGIPTRHLIFNSVGWATFWAALAITGVVLATGLAFRSLSAWCVGACPIRPIEVLYGHFARDRHRPEKCATCTGCIGNCLRVTPERSHGEFGRSRLTAQLAMGFPGFVAAYFLLDLLGWCKVEHEFLAGMPSSVTNWFEPAGLVYGVMATGFAVSWICFQLLERAWGEAKTFRAVALSAFAAYYMGVAPEICEAWNWPMWVAPVLLLPPAAAGVWAMAPAQGPATQST